MRPEFGLPRKLAGETVGTEHDVRDLPRQAGDIEARAVDDLDPLDIGGRNAGQLGDDRVRLGRWPRAVEQHIARRLAQPAHRVILGDREAGHLIQHVEGGRSEEHTSELQSPMPYSYDIFCLQKTTTP